MLQAISTEALIQRRSGPMSMMDVAKERSSYVMPAVRTGQMVIFYPSGSPDSQPLIAFVQRHDDRAKVIEQMWLPMSNRMSVSAVPHISDPILRVGAEHREDGAWDYTEETVWLQDTLDSIAESICLLKETAGIEDSVDDGEVWTMTKYWSRVKWCIENGAKFDNKRPKRPDVVAAMRVLLEQEGKTFTDQE